MVAQFPQGGAADARPQTPPLLPGVPYPLGASCDDDGVNFALFAEHAEAVDLCLFDAEGRQQQACLRLPCRTDGVWHGRLAGARPGQVYGYRVHGPHQPAAGLRFNPARLLLDPCAREVVGQFGWRDEHFDWPPGQDPHGGVRDQRDNAPWALKARVCRDRYDWRGDRPPSTPLADSLFYEVHVRGASIRHPGVASAARGTFAGMASAPMLAHLQRIGVTAVCLLPVHFALDEQRLARQGLRNYWGYNTLAYCVPDPRLACARDGGGQRDEFRDMVRALHGAGIEVILDVVYNHTAESDELGPTLSFRGIDNQAWYRLDRQDPSRYENVTGCGNTLRLAHPRVLQFVMDSLRYWVEEMHVDGFRFDLAVTLGREDHGFDPGSGFFDAVRQDPVLSRVKLIAEPWDIGPGGYQAGAFPAGWSEWNPRFRDGMRACWLGHGGSAGELARRLCGSSELYRPARRQPQAGINLICTHDGFTLADLVSYRDKHNLANGEGNRDGHDDNLSTNCGVEGPSEDPLVATRRDRLAGALLACLMLAQGVPQLLGGDEFGRTQRGNNNAYCQDNAINWFDWEACDRRRIELVAQLAALRRRYPQLRLRSWLDGRSGEDGGEPDVAWSGLHGGAPGAQEWDDPHCRGLQMRLADPGGGPALLLVFVVAGGGVEVVMPPGRWRLLLASDGLAGQDTGREAAVKAGCLELEGPLVLVLEGLAQG